MSIADRFKFDFGAEISVKDFRDLDVVTAALETHHRVRVRRRNDLVGVFLDPEEWSALEGVTRELAEQLEGALRRIEELDDERESAAVESIISNRAAKARFERGNPDLVREIEEELHRQDL